MIRKYGSAKWNGGLKDGRGQLWTESGSLSEQQYGFNQRFEGERGSNPEELIGAAHAGCISMALSGQLGQKNLTAEQISTKATVSLEQKDGGFSITRVHLEVEARVPGADQAAFDEAAQTAKENCPVSKLLNAEITMDAKLVD
ncbi:OsmC family protein [Roseitranquillus sediminis]|uniref:OsmC family protein n=1 Tax=Roseitranquillus sediminis TaxID=2809051 RepID=UPI001D0CB669|nr:OsmC family protein [Roseitranquillus sediminis]MBM9594093.1 OsmC family protein [Roseitranquillus sediminis]